jgi:hypothetical protein
MNEELKKLRASLTAQQHNTFSSNIENKILPEQSVDASVSTTIPNTKINYEQLIMPLLPKSWQNAIDGARKFSNAPFEMLLSVTLGYTNACMHDKFDVEAYWDEEDRHPTSLFIVDISPPASSKSTVMELFEKPLKDFIRLDLLDYNSKRKISNAIAKKRYDNDLKKYDDDQLLTVPTGVQCPALPKYKRQALKVHVNVTLPKFCLNLNDTTHSSFITTEGACMFGAHAFKKPEESNETSSTLCLLWDGAAVNKETKSDAEIHIEDRRVNMLICLQPEYAELVFKYEGGGLCGRILAVSTPAFLKPAPMRTNLVHRQQQQSYKNQTIEFNEVLEKMLQLKILTVSSDEQLRLAPSLIKYSNDCINYIDPFVTNWIKSEIENHSAVGAAANRMTEEWARIAAVLEVYEFVETSPVAYYEDNRSCITISKKTAECAKLILEMFFDQKKDLEIPSMVNFDNANLNASEDLKNWMIRKNINEAEFRDIQRLGPKSCRKNIDILSKIAQEGANAGWCDYDSINRKIIMSSIC